MPSRTRLTRTAPTALLALVAAAACTSGGSPSVFGTAGTSPPAGSPSTTVSSPQASSSASPTPSPSGSASGEPAGLVTSRFASHDGWPTHGEHVAYALKDETFGIRDVDAGYEFLAHPDEPAVLRQRDVVVTATLAPGKLRAGDRFGVYCRDSGQRRYAFYLQTRGTSAAPDRWVIAREEAGVAHVLASGDLDPGSGTAWRLQAECTSRLVLEVDGSPVRGLAAGGVPADAALPPGAAGILLAAAAQGVSVTATGEFRVSRAGSA